MRHKTAPGLVEELPSAGREYFTIRFAQPFEAEHSNWENETGGRAGKVRVTEIQVDYNGEASALAALVGKPVIAEGGIMERNLAGQHRPFIMDVEPGHIAAGAFMLVQEVPAEPEAAKSIFPAPPWWPCSSWRWPSWPEAPSRIPTA